MPRDQVAAALRAVAPQERIITALDVPDGEQGLALARALGPAGQFVKVGLELFSATGPTFLGQLQELGKDVFLDLKFHDIPNTVAGAARVATRLGVALTTIHAAAGRRALEAAAAALESGGPDRPALLAVTVLTSLAAEEAEEVAPTGEECQDRVLRLARLAWDCGCDGLVCAPTDLALLRAEIGPGPLVVTPGIRPAAAAKDDQRRTATAGAAMAAGADFLVIGRPITRASDPGAALREIGRELPA